MKIYRPDGKLWREVVALDSSFCEETLERFNRISLDFVLAEEVLVPELCYVTWRGERYSLFSTPKVVKVSTREYRYTLNLEGRHLELDRVLVKDKLGRTKFVFTGRTDQYAELISDCLPSWKVGVCTTGDATRVIAFNNTSLLEACRMVASKFETEVQLTDGAISFGRVERYKSDPLLLAYRNGLKKDITVEPDPKETAIGRLYVVGGDRNIDPAKYGGHQLHLLKGGKVSVGGHSFVADADGRYISLEGDTRLNTSERAFDASSIYPKRVGTVSKVEQVGEEWDVLDSSNTIDYGQHRVGGDTMRLEFQSGRLAGRTFDLATKEDKLVGYVHSEKRFKLVRKEIDGVLMPEPTTFHPAVGDKYAIFGCSLPDEYITSAEGEMLLRGAEYMAERLEPRLQYRAELDGLWAKKNWATVAHKLVVGTIVRLEGASSEVRISSVRTSLNSPYTPRITFSNAPYMVGSLATQIATLENAEVRQREELRAGLVKLQDRTYKDTEAVREMVEKLKVEGFSQSLKPETLQTMYAVIGSPRLQFEFVGGGFSWTEGKGGAVTIPQQVIRQKVPGNTLEPNPKTKETTIPTLTYTLKADEHQAYIYVELKPTSRYVVSTKPMEITPDRLLVGLLNGTEGSRDFTPLYGFTEISPSHIATRYIRSRSGNMLIDLETGTIYSDKIEFRRPDGSTKDIDQVISEGVQVGGRNLLLKSNEGISNSDYNVGRYYISDPSMMIAGETYTIQIWGEAEGIDFSEALWVYNSGGNTEVANIQKRVNGVWKQIFTWRDDQNKSNSSLVIFRGANHPNYKKESKTSITRIKLEKGSIATDWTPAPEDVQAEIQAVERGYQKLIERVDVEFAISNSRDTAPTSGWQTNAPTPARGQVLWQRTKVYLKDGTTEVRGVTCIQGKDGLDGGDGADGRGIAKIVELYYLSSSNTALANGAWTEIAPTPKEGYWIWTKTRIHYTTGEQLETQPICVTGNKGDRGERGLQGLQGKDGTNGLPGRDGKDGKTSYTHIAYADTATGGGFSQSPAGKAYIGMYVDFVQTDSTDPSKYAWSLIKGADGKNGLNGKDGVPGKPGADGRTPYLHIAYANSQDGKQGFSVSVSEGKSYIGTYTDYTQADSTDPTKYSWSKIKGEDATQVRDNLWTLSQYSLGQNDAYGCTLTQLPDRKLKIEKKEPAKVSWFSAASYYTSPIKNPPGRYTISFKVVECSRAIRYYRSNGIDKNRGALVGDFYYETGTSSDGRLPAFAFTWGEAGTDDQARIGDYAIIKDIKIERVEEGEDPKPTAYIPHPDDLKGKDADPKEVQEIKRGLTNANTLISTLDKAQKKLEKGVLTKADIKDIQYLLDSLKNGKTQVAGGLVLTNDIILSDPNSKDVTAMISGTQTEGAKAIRLGIAKDGSETTVLNNDGTGHVGNLYFEGNRLDVREGGETLLKIGVNAIDEQVQHLDTKGRVSRSYDVAKTTIKECGEVVLTTFSTDRDGADVSLHGKLMVTYPALSRRLPVDYDFSGWEKGGGGYTLHIGYTLGIRYAGQRMCVPFAMLVVRAMASKRDGGYDVRNLKLIHQDPLNERPLHDTYADFDEWGDIKALPHKGKYELVLGMSHREIGAKSWMGATASFVGAPTPKVVVTTKPDRNKSSISTRGARFYGDENSYFDVDYTRQSNVTAQIKGGLKVDTITADSYQGNGMPLAGATFNSSGGEVRALGRYKNKRNASKASAGYDYSYKTYTVYHSIPHDKYIPLVTPFGTNGSNANWNLAVRIYEVKAYSFTMKLLTNQDNPTQNGFSYIAFQAE